MQKTKKKIPETYDYSESFRYYSVEENELREKVNACDLNGDVGEESDR